MKPYEIHKILVPIDFSDTSLKAIDHAIVLAKLSGASVTLLHVIEESINEKIISSGFNKVEIAELEYEANEKFSGIITKLKESGIENVKTLTAFGHVHDKIVLVSKRIKADIIVMGTHGVKGLREFAVGSNSFRVVTHANCPVLSVQQKPQTVGFKNIMLPFSDRPHSREKVMYAISLARICGATIHLLGIDDMSTPQHTKKISMMAEQTKAFVEDHGVECKMEVVSMPYTTQTVLNYAKKINTDLIMARGDSEKQNFVDYLTGTYSNQMVNHSPIPVFCIHSEFNPANIELWSGI